MVHEEKDYLYGGTEIALKCASKLHTHCKVCTVPFSDKQYFINTIRQNSISIYSNRTTFSQSVICLIRDRVFFDDQKLC